MSRGFLCFVLRICLLWTIPSPFQFPCRLLDVMSADRSFVYSEVASGRFAELTADGAGRSSVFLLCDVHGKDENGVYLLKVG